MSNLIKTLDISLDSWNKIYNKIAKDYPNSVLLIREKTKEVLGFIVRRHREWVPQEGTGIYDGYGEYIETIKLDFYDEKKKTFFLLKYGDLMVDQKQ